MSPFTVTINPSDTMRSVTSRVYQPFGRERASQSHSAYVEGEMLAIEHRFGSSIGLRPPKTIMSPSPKLDDSHKTPEVVRARTEWSPNAPAHAFAAIFSNCWHFALYVGRMEVACPLPVDTPLVTYISPESNSSMEAKLSRSC
jgi:hypothetical protein